MNFTTYKLGSMFIFKKIILEGFSLNKDNYNK